MLYTGHLKKVLEKLEKSAILFHRSAIFAKKCPKVQFWLKSVKNRFFVEKFIIMQICKNRAIFAQKCGITSSHFSICPVYNAHSDWLQSMT